VDMDNCEAVGLFGTVVNALAPLANNARLSTESFILSFGCLKLVNQM
jgi:hypothetical protein